jgi:hypothetical protein
MVTLEWSSMDRYLGTPFWAWGMRRSISGLRLSEGTTSEGTTESNAKKSILDGRWQKQFVYSMSSTWTRYSPRAFTCQNIRLKANASSVEAFA